MNDRKGYTQIVDAEEKIFGYHAPADAKAKYENSNINYKDIVGNDVTIKAHHIPSLLRELREKGADGWKFATIFHRKGTDMQGLAEFEKSLQASPTTALMDYWLLRLGGHIQILQNKKDSEANNLSNLYFDLVKKLQNFETEMGKLANNPSRHQNEQRKKLVEEFQNDWQATIEPAQKKYKEIDANNILKNLAAAFTIVGFIWLFCKNLYRLSQGKGLGLFQFENAHSRKLEHLQKLYADVEKATAADAAKRENYFSHDIEDAKKAHKELGQITADLQKLHTDTQIDGVYTKKERKDAKQILDAYTSLLTMLAGDIDDYDPNEPDAEISLLEDQKDFMEKWQTAGYAQGLAQKIGEDSPYPESFQKLFQKIIDISNGFAAEIENTQSELDSRKRPRGPSMSDSGSSDY
ncbi:MAG: hypothetical protein ACO1N3_05095 [Gammaproteobacteria bacterium]